MDCDVLVVGAGAAGLMAAGAAVQRGRRVAVLEHTGTIGAKILISGGGRCNFTNLHPSPDRFISENKHFAKSALARYTQNDFIGLVKKHRIAFYEKTLGQLFCEGAGSARKIVALLLAEAEGALIRTDVSISAVRKTERFGLETSAGPFTADSLIVATGGLSIPKLGASAFAYRLAEQFGVPIVAPRPALVPLVFAPQDLSWMAPLSGLAVEAVARCNGAAFQEGLLFTHRGLSGPSILQISSYWRKGDAIAVDFSPDGRLGDALLAFKRTHPKAYPKAALHTLFPERLAEAFAARFAPEARLADCKDQALLEMAAALRAVHLRPSGDEGYAKAEVTVGGISTDALDQKTMAVKAVPGLYFVGEAVDVTGWLGGYNFQWAWSSGWAAGLAA
jgi:predicted Rossmann fold flavoprotein